MREEIEKIGKVEKSEGAGLNQIASEENQGPNKAYFDQLMQRPEEDLKAVQVQATNEAAQTKPSPIETIGHTQKVERVTPAELVEQTQSIVSKIEKAKETLAAPNIQIKKSAQGELHSRLTHIDENIQIALSKAGVEFTPASPTVSPTGNVVEKFLGMLTHSQSQMTKLTREVDKVNITGGHLSPTQMLALQIKVGNVQAELEFFTAALAKSIESIKTLMNVQI